MTAVTRRLAMAILNGFDAFFAEYKNITLGAQARFEGADWHGAQKAMRDRLDLWKQKRRIVAEAAYTITGGSVEDRDNWEIAKQEYAELIQNHDNFEIAQSFFNSIYCYIFKHEKIRDVHTFALTSVEHCAPVSSESILRRYRFDGDNAVDITKSMLIDCEFNIPWEDLDRDVGFIMNVVNRELIPKIRDRSKDIYVETLESLFFRNKAAYLVGRIVSGDFTMPFVLPILHSENNSIFVDTVLSDPDDISILFSFSRSYFMVDTSVPSEYIAFLHRLMPHKEIFELYIASACPSTVKPSFIALR